VWDDLLHFGRGDPSHRGLADPGWAGSERVFPWDDPSHRGLAAAHASEADLGDLGRKGGRDDPSHRGLTGSQHYVQIDLELFGRPVRGDQSPRALAGPDR